MRFFFNPVSGQLNAGPPREIVYADTAPQYPLEGSRWFDTINLREYVYTGTEWVESGVGPAGVKGDTGDKGDKGDVGPLGPVGPQGPAATVAVGTVTTGAAGTNASVSNSGTSGAAVFDFTIPQGAKGDTGNIGPQGPQGIQGVKGDDGASISLKGAVATPADLTSIAIKTQGDLYVAQSDGNGYVWDGSTWVNVGQIRGPKGDTGAQGPAGPAPAGTGVVVVSNGVTGTPVGYGTANTANTLVQRDASGNFSVGVITGNLTGNVTGGVTGNVTGNASTASKLATARAINVSGDVTGTAQNFDGSAAITIPTAIAPGVIVNADINAAAAIADTKLATISTANKVSNSATTATSANTASAIVARDTNGNFSAGTITADLFSGNASTASSAAKLSTARKINNVTFDGSADITISAAPTSHTHGNITNAGAIGTTASLPIVTGTNGVLQAGSFGTTAGTFCQGNDTRLSDSRTPTSHTHPYSQITDSPYKDGVTVATTAALTANYANGTSGVGATLTNSGALTVLVIDGVTATVGMRVLVKNQATSTQNGIYSATSVGSSTVAWVLTRATDSDSNTELGGAIVSVDRGTSGGKLFSTSFKTTDTVGTTACLWQQIYDQGDAATSNTANTLVLRDASGNFSAGVVTATQIVAQSATATVGAVAGVAGLMSAADKTKLDGVATNANNYAHPTGDGNLHVPATSTTNNGKVLKAGATAGSLSWGTLTAADVGAAASSHTHPYSQITDSPYKDGVTVATTAALTAIYSNGASGVGATLSNFGTLAALVIDGLTVSSVGTRVLIKDQTLSAENGIYTLTTAGSTTVAWVLTRATDADSKSELGGAVVSVDRGTTNGGKLFSTSFTTSSTVGTSACPWQQIFDQADAATTDTANKLVLRDSAGGFRAGEIISTSLLSGAIVSQGNITVQNTSPRVALEETDGITYYLLASGSNFYVTADRDASGNWETPHPLQLNANTELARVFGYDILHTGNSVRPWVTKTAAYTAVAGDRIVANTTAAAFTITLPATPADYTEIVFADHYEQWATRNLTIARNGQNIEGLAENLVCNVAGVQFTMRYEGTTWRIYT